MICALPDWFHRGFSLRAKWVPFFLGMINPAVAHASPLQYLSGAGDKAVPVVWLTWGLLAISLAVIAVVSLLLVGAVWRRPGQNWTLGAQIALQPHQDGLNWLWIGVGISTLVLLISVIWTVKVLAQIQAPNAKPSVTIEITGKQWWWQVRYLSDDLSRSFTTANEIHMPIGVPIRLKLIGGDVIHSFWVPQLAGKMDAIPGQTNETWIEAAAPGTYNGQCTEYCGLQHAHMGVVVVAQSRTDFRNWWNDQLRAPRSLQGAALSGQVEFLVHCGSCHTIRGTEAAGAQGPDLSHLMGRATIAAASFPNDGQTLAHWIADPQSLKPGSLMPAPAVSQADLASINNYLHTLD